MNLFSHRFKYSRGAMYYMRSKLTGRYENSFDTFQDLLAYLAHFNTYIDKDHPIRDSLSCGMNNNVVVNYCIGIRLFNRASGVINKNSLNRKTIKKLIKNCDIQLDSNGDIIVNDLEIVDHNGYTVELSSHAIEAILSRYCNITDFKSCYDTPNFIYRKTPVSKVTHWSRRGKIKFGKMQELRKLSDPKTMVYSRVKRLSYNSRIKHSARSINWKDFGKYRHQWSAKASRKAV